jgi:hypothetical protein
VRFFGIALEDPAPGAESSWPEPDRVRASIGDRRAIARVTVALREQIVGLAGDPDPAGKRAELERAARAELAALPLRVLDPAKVAAGARLTNACLALRGTYIENLPRHAEVLAALGGNLEAMVSRLTEISESGGGAQDFYQILDQILDSEPTSMQSGRANPHPGSVADQFDHAFVNQTAKHL